MLVGVLAADPGSEGLTGSYGSLLCQVPQETIIRWCTATLGKVKIQTSNYGFYRLCTAFIPL